MKDEKFRVTLNPKEDRNGKIFHVGQCKFPGSIDFTNGVVFFVFTSEEGAEELQIAQEYNEDDPKGSSRTSSKPKQQFRPR